MHNKIYTFILIKTIIKSIYLNNYILSIFIFCKCIINFFIAQKSCCRHRRWTSSARYAKTHILQLNILRYVLNIVNTVILCQKCSLFGSRRRRTSYVPTKELGVAEGTHSGGLVPTNNTNLKLFF